MILFHAEAQTRKQGKGEQATDKECRDFCLCQKCYTDLKKECNTLITPLPNPLRLRGGCATARLRLSVANIF
jgi:hypothetical protein